MQKRQKTILATILSTLIIFSGISIYLISLNPFIITESNFNTNVGSEIESGAQRLNFQLDSSQNRHFIYQLGERPSLEPDTGPYIGSHVLKYGVIVDDVLVTENVTDELVFPYHYDLRVDSFEQVHVVYITNNFTMYYSVRDPTTRIWATTQMNTPSEMFAMMPSITLGTNEQPRIVYSVSFKEDADIFFNQEGGEVINLSSLMYAVWNGSTWLYFDLAENHSTNPFEQRDINRQRIYNPAIKIEDGFAYIAFTKKVSQAVETRMQYIKIPEIPEDTNFLSRTHQRAKIAVVQSTTFRRPSIHLVGDGVLLAFGAWTFGGGSVILLSNASALQNPNPLIAANEWLKVDLLQPTKLNKQLEAVVGVENQNGTIFIVWSLYDLFNAATLEFSNDVFLISFNPTTADIGFDPDDVERVTDTTQVNHYTPSVAVTEENTLEIHYIKEEGGIFSLKTSTFGGIEQSFDDEGLAFVASLSLIALFVGVSIAVIQLIPKPEEDVVILPHMINLKDVITDD